MKERIEIKCEKDKAQIDWLKGRANIGVEDFADIQRLFGIQLHQNYDGETVMHAFNSDIYEQVAKEIRKSFWKLIFNNIRHIEGTADFEKSEITSLSNLQSIGRNAYFKGSQITDLGNLQSIGGNACFRGSQVISLGNLHSIGGIADFESSQVTDLGKLQSIGQDAFFRNTKITSLGNLQTIGEYADFENSQVTDLGNLRSIGMEALFGAKPTLSKDVIEKIKTCRYGNIG